MSEIEINEDNCVLSEMELLEIKSMIKERYKYTPTNQPQKIFQKITKLNDIVKYMEEQGILVYGGDAELVLSKRGKEKLGISNE